MATRHIQPFTTQVWNAEGATIGNQDYSGTPSATIGATSSTFTATERNVVVNGAKYRIEFDRWSYTYTGTFPNWAGRITENGAVLSVDNSYDDVDEGVLSGTLTVVAHMRAVPLSPGDPHYEDDVEYVVTVYTDPADGSGGTAAGGGMYASGASCTITATPEDGYAFVSWTSSDGQTVTTTSHTFTVSQDVTWTAHFGRKSILVITYSTPPYSGNAEIYPREAGWPYDERWRNYGASGDSVRLVANAVPGWRGVRWTCGGYTFTSADVTVALSDSFVEANKVYNSARQRYVLPFTAEFEPTSYNTIKMRILEGADYSTLQRVSYWTPNGTNSADISQYVTVVKDTASEYEVRVPVTYGPVMESLGLAEWPYGSQYGHSYPRLLPAVRQNRIVYKYVVTLNGVATTYDDPRWDFSDGMVWNSVDGLTPEVSILSGNGATLTVDFYVKRATTGKLLCTAQGTMLCNSSGDPLYDG
jgi:hypothetical protein